MKLLRKEREITEQYIKQDFYPHEQGNGKIIVVSADGRYYYEPMY